MKGSRPALLLCLLALVPAAGAICHAPAALADDNGGGDNAGGDDGGDDGGGNDGGGDNGGDNGGSGNNGGNTSSGAQSDNGGDDHVAARAGRKSGRLVPLSVILARLRKVHGGKVLDVRLHGRGRKAVYVIRLLDRKSHLRVLRIRAATPRYRTNFKSGG